MPATTSPAATSSSGSDRSQTGAPPFPPFAHKHLLSISQLNQHDIINLLQRSDAMIAHARQPNDAPAPLAGKTQINLFFENSTRTRASFEIAGQRLGANIVNMQVASSSISKGETLIDTAATLNAMGPDVIVVRHDCAGAVELLSQKVGCAVINAGDGAHEHPTQALLDALTIQHHKQRLNGLTVAICGDVANSRVARSNLALLGAMNVRTRVIAPRPLLPPGIEQLCSETYTCMHEGLAEADVVMMLRLQHERTDKTGAGLNVTPSSREYYRFFGLDEQKLSRAHPDVLVMHPGPMNRGVEIDPAVADGPRSVITYQVEMGVAVRMAVLDALLNQPKTSRP